MALKVAEKLRRFRATNGLLAINGPAQSVYLYLRPWSEKWGPLRKGARRSAKADNLVAKHCITEDKRVAPTIARDDTSTGESCSSLRWAADNHSPREAITRRHEEVTRSAEQRLGTGRRPSATFKRRMKKTPVRQGFATVCESTQETQVEDRGLEPLTS